MATVSDIMSLEEVCNKLDKYVLKMKDRHKLNRKDSLYEYFKLVFEDLEEEGVDDFPYLSRLNLDLITFTNLLSDESEINRLKTTEILIEYIKKDALEENKLVYLITTIHMRICNDCEESEEVRASLLLILKLIINQYGGKLSTYVDDVSAVLLHIMKDRSPEVLIASCDCITLFFDALKLKLQIKSSAFIKPLTNVTFHQRFKVRKASIRALGSVGTWCDGGTSMNEVALCIAQHSDDIPQVRITLVHAASKLAVQMPDRYSYWHCILPCLLLWLRDSDTGTRSAAVSQYSAVGEQYLEENREQLQQQIAFDLQPARYPASEVPRLNLGCRLLAQAVTHTLLPGIGGDLRDWRSESRWATSKLLSALVLLGELKLQQHALTVIRLLAVATRDTEERVVAEAFTCAEYLGHFLLPSCSIPLCLQVVKSSAAVAHHRSLRLLQLLTVGLTTPMLSPYIPTILDRILADALPLMASDPVVQEDALVLINALLDKCLVDQDQGDDDGLSNLVDTTGLVNLSCNSAESSERAGGDRELLLAASRSENRTACESKKCNDDAKDLSEQSSSSNLESASTNSESRLRGTNNISSCKSVNPSQEGTREENILSSLKILRILCLIIGSERCNANIRTAGCLLQKLAENSGGKAPRDVIARHAASLLVHFLPDSELWTLEDPEFMAASAFLKLAGECLPVSSVPALLRLYRTVLAASDRLVHARLLGLLCPLVASEGGALRRSPHFSAILAQLTKEWLGALILDRSSSREVEVVRSGALELLAAACLAGAGTPAASTPPADGASGAAEGGGGAATEVLKDVDEFEHVNQAEQHKLLSEALSPVASAVPQLLEDDILETRHSALLLLLHLTQRHPHLLHTRLLPPLINGLVGRLDDVHSSVRALAGSIFGKVVLNLHRYYTNQQHQLTNTASTRPGQDYDSQQSSSSQEGSPRHSPSVRHPQSVSPSHPGCEGTASCNERSPSEAPTGVEPVLALERCMEEVVPRLLLFLEDPAPQQRSLVHESCTVLLPLYPGLLRQNLQLQRQRCRGRDSGLAADLLCRLGVAVNNNTQQQRR